MLHHASLERCTKSRTASSFLLTCPRSVFSVCRWNIAHHTELLLLMQMRLKQSWESTVWLKHKQCEKDLGSHYTRYILKCTQGKKPVDLNILPVLENKMWQVEVWEQHLPLTAGGGRETAELFRWGKPSFITCIEYVHTLYLGNSCPASFVTLCWTEDLRFRTSPKTELSFSPRGEHFKISEK